MARFLWICLGGAAGTGARYLLSGWLARTAGPGFPWGTLAVNVLGSFLLGLILQVALATETFPPTLRLALTTGVMGGFTTYSTFNYETLQYFQQDEWLLGLASLGATVTSCLVAGILGVFAGRLLAGS
ncbi:MAG TPA: fluoride efflux transporter CrcB [Thermoanaerobaculia bacterium]|jgi:CrcB protein|nr:fluoride efflux transporter CrcB [Thermoanaerobaculia bacterium]